MTIIRNQDYEQFSQIEDERIRESFRVLYDNTAALQEQVEQLKTKIVEATDLADLQTEVSTLFDGSASSNAGASFTLPVATSSTLGGVKDGAGVTIASDGTLSVDTHNHDIDYADANHGHTGYASSGHAHTGVYQPAGNYASSGHAHSEYASSGHAHSEYASSGHAHTGVYQPAGNYASSGHGHTIGYSDLDSTLQSRAKIVTALRFSYSTNIPFSNSERTSRIYFRSDSSSTKICMFYIRDITSGIRFQMYYYTVASGTTNYTSDTLVYQNSAVIQDV
jgi:hypothetical protein